MHRELPLYQSDMVQGVSHRHNALLQLEVMQEEILKDKPVLLLVYSQGRLDKEQGQLQSVHLLVKRLNIRAQLFLMRGVLPLILQVLDGYI
jgi:hypothetical protein